MNIFKRALIRGNIIAAIIKKIDYFIGVLFRKIFYTKNEVQNNKLFIMTYNNSYTDNPRYIVDEILRQKLPIDIVWVGTKKGNSYSFPPEVRVVKRASAEMYEEQGTAKVWIDNALNCVWYGMPKKKSQVYINTWHGSMGIKKLSGNSAWFRRARKCKNNTDYCITNSAFEEDVFRTTFWPKNEFKKFGHARNDIFFLDDYSEIKEEVYKELNIDMNKKTLLYAPTFRDDGDVSCFDMDLSLLKESLEKKFGGKWVILVRFHYKNKNIRGMIQYDKDIVDASLYPDMQKLLACVDAGITDYSSWAYDFVLSKKPMFIYATDIEKYDGDRGFYYSIYTTPFPIATNNVEMCNNILNFDNEKYLLDVDKFLEDKGCYEKGTASKETVELIKEIMGIE